MCGNGRAEVHCAADKAFLCVGCDFEVHGAHFLSARHRRTRVVVVSAPKPAEETSSSSLSPARSRD